MKGNTNAAQSITVDNVLSTTSTNPVQNKTITAALNSIPTVTAMTPTEFDTAWESA